MITQKSIECYKGISLSRGRNCLYIPPHIILQPYIANYTISFPTSMPDEYTVMPTASSTLCIAVSSDSIICGLRGVNTKACNVGAYANKMKLLLLIEFHPGGLKPFIRIDQSELVDSSFVLEELDKKLTHALKYELIKSERIDNLVEALDKILIDRLTECHTGKGVAMIMRNIVQRHGAVCERQLTAEFFYNEKQIRRLFLRHVGISPKVFARIVRANYALGLLQNDSVHLADIAVQAGFYDQPHFIHDFKTICGLTPLEYRRNMSVFYNDKFKM